MKRINLTITALSPLAIGRQKPGGSISEAETYIPGTVISGAIAAEILRQAGDISPDLTQTPNDFQTLFLAENAAIFHNAYPAIAKHNQRYELTAQPIQVFPATAVSAKAKPGFKTYGSGVFDTLIDCFYAKLLNHAYDPSCPQCLQNGVDARVEPYNGFYSQQNEQYATHTTSTRFLTRVGINRQRATAEDDILYSIEVLNESYRTSPHEWNHYVYRSAIQVESDALADDLITFINSNDFRMGGSTSRGLGKVELEAAIAQPASDIGIRIDRFNQALNSRWQYWSVLGNTSENPTPPYTYFTLNLQADAILTEEWRRTTVISEEMLRQLVGVKDESLRLCAAYSSYDYRSGWNAAWGLMKDMELVTQKGGVYLFRTEDRSLWEEPLSRIERQGVGDRTCEGFGQVEVCSEFHCIFRENAR